MRNEFLLKEERMRKTGKKEQNAPNPTPHSWGGVG